MKRKLAFKLTLYFVAVSLVLTLLTATAFLTMLRNFTANQYKQQMEDRAKNIARGIGMTLSNAESMSASIETGDSQLPPSIPGANAPESTMPSLNSDHSTKGTSTQKNPQIPHSVPSIVQSVSEGDDFWLINTDGEIYLSEQAQKGPFRSGTQPNNSKELPAGTESVIENSLAGKVTFTENFSSIFSSSTITVGVPGKSRSGKILGAVLLHSEVRDLNKIYRQSTLMLLLCILAGLLITVAVSLFVSFSIAKPVKKMNDTALQLAAGDYSAKSGVKGKDEIGELGGSLDQLADRLDEAKKESDNLEQLRRDFVGNVSHELRTPLTVIRACTESLIDGVYTDEEDVRKQYHNIISEGSTLERLVRDLLDLSKLQNMKFHIASEPVDLTVVIRDTIASMSIVAKEKNIKIDSNVCEAPLIFPGDYGRIKQMLVIVLDNALKFTPEGGCVQVVTGKQGADCTVSITDFGDGIEEEKLPYIFDRFYKTDTSHNIEGTGLGLAIAKEIAGKMGITIEVSSKCGEGTTFHFTFPNCKNKA